MSADPSGLKTSSTWNFWTPTLQNSSLLVPYVEDPQVDAISSSEVANQLVQHVNVYLWQWGDMFQWAESDGSVDDGPNTSDATDLEELSDHLMRYDFLSETEFRPGILWKTLGSFSAVISPP